MYRFMNRIVRIQSVVPLCVGSYGQYHVYSQQFIYVQIHKQNSMDTISSSFSYRFIKKISRLQIGGSFMYTFVKRIARIPLAVLLCIYSYSEYYRVGRLFVDVQIQKENITEAVGYSFMYSFLKIISLWQSAVSLCIYRFIRTLSQKQTAAALCVGS